MEHRISPPHCELDFSVPKLRTGLIFYLAWRLIQGPQSSLWIHFNGTRWISVWAPPPSSLRYLKGDANLFDPMWQSMSPDEQRLFRLYGKLPTKRDLLQNKLKVGDSRPRLFWRPLSDPIGRSGNTSILAIMHWVRPAKLQMSALPTLDLVTHSLKTSLIWLPHLPWPTAWSGALTPLKPNQPPEVSAAILGRSAFIAEVRSRRLVSCIEGPLQTNLIRLMSQQRTILSKSLRRNWVQVHRLWRACQSGDRL